MYRYLFVLFSFFVAHLHGVIHLTQSDFDSGTYRIKVADTYILDEDIYFQPIPEAEQTRTDKPVTGWFAAITVETDNVVIDLNGKTLQASRFYVDNFIFNVFADIELDNSPFPGILFGLAGVFFPGDLSFVSANNVVVKNGTLGLSTHWGVRGNNNTNVELANMKIKDFEVAAISLNGPVQANIHDIDIDGTMPDVRIDFLHSVSATLINFLATLTQMGYPGAADKLSALTLFVNDNPQIFNTVSPIPKNSVYGVLITSGFSSAATFPTTPEDCAFAAFLANGRTAENVEICDVHVKNLKSAPEEAVLVGSQATQGISFNLGQSGLPIIGCPRWEDAFDSNGNFAPNPFLQAMAFAAEVALSFNPGYIDFLPPNFTQIIASILNPDETAFFNETQPLFGAAIDNFSVKGNFAFRIDCASMSNLKRCSACGVENLGRRGVELKDIPGSAYYPNLAQSRYAGNDVWGFETATSDLITFDCCKASSISTRWGDAFGFHLAGFHLAGFSSAIQLKECTSEGIYGFSDTTDSAVNLPSVAYGFEIENNPGPIAHYNCLATKIKAPRFAFGFSDENSSEVLYRCSTAKKIAATSSSNLSYPKEAFGFTLEGANDTRLECVTIKDVAIYGEKGAGDTQSKAAGINIDAESVNTTIICPKIENISGAKIRNKGIHTIIKKKKQG